MMTMIFIFTIGSGVMDIGKRQEQKEETEEDNQLLPTQRRERGRRRQIGKSH